MAALTLRIGTAAYAWPWGLLGDLCRPVTKTAQTTTLILINFHKKSKCFSLIF